MYLERTALKRLQARHRLPSRIFLLGTGVVGLSLLLTATSVVAVQWIAFASWVVTIVAFSFAYVLKCLTRCPRCKKLFYWAFPLGFLWFRKRCIHCGFQMSTQWIGTAAEIERLRRWEYEHQSGEAIPDVGLQCPQCGYPLGGLMHPACPECGTTVNIRELLRALSFDG